MHLLAETGLYRYRQHLYTHRDDGKAETDFTDKRCETCHEPIADLDVRHR